MRAITVWIIEDKDIERADAQKILQGIMNEGSFTLCIEFADDFEWPPRFGRGQNADAEKLRLPDILILDLFDQGELKGDSFYAELRAAEASYAKPLGARVIIWSGYWSDASAEDFVKNTLEHDPRFIALETKDKFSLEDALKGCLSQIEEEEFVSNGY